PDFGHPPTSAITSSPPRHHPRHLHLHDTPSPRHYRCHLHQPPPAVDVISTNHHQPLHHRHLHQPTHHHHLCHLQPPYLPSLTKRPPFQSTTPSSPRPP
nr:hypothetical protein [Tanacetum cinerariifolium]